MAAAIDLERLVVQMEARLGTWEKELKRANNIYDRESRGIEKRQTQLQKRLKEGTSQIARSFVPSIGAIAAGLSVREIVQYGDAWTTAGNKIAAAGTAPEMVSKRLRELADLAVETRTALDPTVTLFARMERATAKLGKSEQDLLGYTSTINKAFVVGGAAASEQTAGVLQLTQAISSGLLQGDELRSVRENASVIAQAIADVMGVSIGQLKQLGAEGKITVDVILKALDKVAPAVDAAFAKTQLTVGQSLGNLETRFTQFVGGLSESGKFALLAGGINLVADNLENLTKAAGVAAAALAPAGLAAAYGLSTRAAGALTAAIVANPLGAFIVVVSAVSAALYLYGIQSEAATLAQDELTAAHRRAHPEIYGTEKAINALARSNRQLAIDTETATLALKRQAAELLQARAYAEYLTRRKTFSPVDKADFRFMTSMDDKQFEGFLKENVGSTDGKQKLREYREALKSVEGDTLSVEGRIAKLLKMSDKAFDGKGGDTATSAGAAAGDPKAYDNAVQSITAQTARYDALGDVTDRTTLELKKAEAQTRLLTAAQEAGKKITPELTAEIDRLALAYGNAAAKNDFQKALSGSDQHLRELQQDADQVGLTAVQVDALRFKQELLNAATQAYGEVSDATRVQIDAATESYATQAQRIHDTVEGLQNQIDLADAARSGLMDIGTAGLHSFGDVEDALGRAITRMGEMILQMYVLKPLIESVFGEMGTTGGGWLGTAISAIGSTFAGAFADGGYAAPNKVALVGERGPELIKTGSGGLTVTPRSKISMPTVPTLSAAGGEGLTQVNNFYTIDARGAAPGVAAEIKAALSAINDSIEPRAVKAVARARKGGGSRARALG